METLCAGKVATGQFAISSTGATKRKIEDEISVDDSSDESFVTAIVNKDAPLTAVKQRDRQPLLKKSPTDKVFDLLSSIVGGKSESKLSEALRIFSELHSKIILSGNVYSLKNIFPTHPVMQRHF